MSEQSLAVPSAVSRRADLPRPLGIALMLLTGLLSISLSMWLILPHLTATEYLTDGATGPANPPWTIYKPGIGNHLELDLQPGPLTPLRWSVTYRGQLREVRINGEKLPATLLPLATPENGFWQSLVLTFRGWRPGSNHIEFFLDVPDVPDVVDGGYGPRGSLAFEPEMGWRSLLLGAGFLPWLLGLSALFRLRQSQVAILAIAIEICCVYWSATPWNVRGHDVLGIGGHLDYVRFVADHLALPLPTQGSTYFHPPLYYIAGAAVWRWAEAFGVRAPAALQGMSLTFWLVFLVAAAGSLRLCLRRSPLVLLQATAALALWPSGIAHSVRIGNDVALYATAAVATWMLLRWHRSGRRDHLFGAAAMIDLAFLAKSNAFVLAAALAGLIGLRLLLRPRPRRAGLWFDGALALAIVGCGVALSLGNSLYYYWHGQLDHWLVGNAKDLPAELRVPVQLGNFLPWDMYRFLVTPWLDAYNVAGEHANFWNYLLRSALTSGFHFNTPTSRLVALAWGGLLLALLLLLLIPVRKCWSIPALWRDAPLWLLGLLWPAGLLALRIMVPYSCSNDFRYILPVLVPFVVAAARKSLASRALLLAIAAGSSLFFLTL